MDRSWFKRATGVGKAPEVAVRGIWRILPVQYSQQLHDVTNKKYARVYNPNVFEDQNKGMLLYH